MQKKQSFAADTAVASISLESAEGGAREVVDEKLIGKAAQVDAESGGQAHRYADAWNLRQTADDRFLLCAPEALVVSCHARADGIWDGLRMLGAP